MRTNARTIIHGAIVFTAIAISAQDRVEIPAGDNVQAIVNGYPVGTIFVIKAGVHRLQSISPRNGDTFEGEDGAILCGGRELNDWVQQGKYWVHEGVTEEGNHTLWTYCLSNVCRFPENVFYNDTFMTPVEALSDVVPGMYYFDYGADQVYIADDPTGNKLEIASSTYAFYGNASNVTIRNLVVEKYASDLINRGAINCEGGSGWLVENCEVRLVHMAGIALRGSNNTVRQCRIHHVGEMGIFFSGDQNGLVEDNEMFENAVPEVGFDGYYWGSACKFGNMNGIIVRGNYSHHNNGPGLWTDGGNRAVLYENNLVEYNSHQGIFHEISYDAVIRCNIVRDNGFHPSVSEWLWGGQIQIANSSGAEIYDNIVEVHADYGNAITMTYQRRGRTATANNYVHNNIVTFKGSHGHMGVDADYNQSNFWSNNTNRFDYNTYHIFDQEYYYWKYAAPGFSGRMSPMVTFEQWQELGQDINGAIDGNTARVEASESCGDIGVTAIYPAPSGGAGRRYAASVENGFPKNTLSRPMEIFDMRGRSLGAAVVKGESYRSLSRSFTNGVVLVRMICENGSMSVRSCVSLPESIHRHDGP